MMQQVSCENWPETATAERNQIESPGVQVHHKDFYQRKEITTLCRLKQSGGNRDQCELSYPLNTFSMLCNAIVLQHYAKALSIATLCTSSPLKIINRRNRWIV